MGWHCDSKYSKKGEFLPRRNTQLINTPVVIFTVGFSRILKWRQRCLNLNNNGNLIWHYDKSSEFEMLLEEGHLLLIHPRDEVPNYCTIQGAVCNYQHGQVHFNKCNGMSIGFVFRNTTSKARFDKKTNVWIQNQDEIIVPKDMYDKVDIPSFHNSMMCNLNAVFGS